MKLPEPEDDRPSVSDLQATIRVPELSDRPIQSVESRSVIRPIGGHAAPADEALGATLRSDDSAAPEPARSFADATARSERGDRAKPDEMRGTGWNLRRPAEPPPAPEAKGLSGTTVIVLILVAFIAGGAIAAWVAKTYLLKGSLDAAPSGGALVLHDSGPSLPRGSSPATS